MNCLCDDSAIRRKYSVFEGHKVDAKIPRSRLQGFLDVGEGR
jgi:hypothetical protein